MPPQTFQCLPLDPTIYSLRGNENVFFKTQTGIQNDEELQKHITRVQAEAYAVYPYPCIRSFSFTTLKISRHPAYKEVLKIGHKRSGAILLDLGCCFGNDVRKAIADGFPRENVIASDLHPEYWMLGHKLFKTTKETYPVTFLPGDIFDPSFMSPRVLPAPTSTIPPATAPPLSTLRSLTPLQHRISVIHTSSFFHLFHDSQQRALAHLLGALLSPLPGSVILGSDMGLSDAEDDREGDMRAPGVGVPTFGKSPKVWEKIWVGKGGVFRPEDVILQTKAVDAPKNNIVHSGGDPTYTTYLIVWSVTRA